MGIYINPPDCSKEEFLSKHGISADPKAIMELHNFKESIVLPVIIVHNQFFSAAAVCYSRQEMEAFLDPKDFRPKKCHFVPRDILEDESKSGIIAGTIKCYMDE